MKPSVEFTGSYIGLKVIAPKLPEEGFVDMEVVEKQVGS